MTRDVRRDVHGPGGFLGVLHGGPREWVAVPPDDPCGA